MTQIARILGLGVVGTVIFLSRPAAACSYVLGLSSPAVYCDLRGEVPSNFVVPTEKVRGLEQADAFASDAMSERIKSSPAEIKTTLARDFSRLRPGTPAGTTLRSREQNPYTCPLDVRTTGIADTQAPETPVLADVVVDLTIDPADTGCYSCPDTDGISLFVTNVKDDRAPTKSLYIAVYEGATREEAAAATTVSHLAPAYAPKDLKTSPRTPIGAPEATTAAVHAVLGESTGRARRPNAGMLSAGQHCVAVEVVDWAGNFSPRSNAICFDHTDESDAHVRTSDGGTSCSVGGARLGTGNLLVFVASLLAVARLLRRRGRLA